MDRTAPSWARPLDRSFLGAALLAALIALLAGCGERAPALGSKVSADRFEEDDDDGSTVRVPGATEVFAPNPSGIGRTLTPGGSINTKNLFFQSVGINGRACVSCHVASQGWTITPAGVRDRFERTGGLAALGTRHDGAKLRDLPRRRGRTSRAV